MRGIPILVGLLVAASTGCGGPGSEDATITADELRSRIDAGRPPAILDVRTAAEFGSGHVPGARNIPHTEIDERIDQLGAERDAPIVVYCERGGRARLAEQGLRHAGFTQVLHLDGDMSGWRDRGFPVER